MKKQKITALVLCVVMAFTSVSMASASVVSQPVSSQTSASTQQNTPESTAQSSAEASQQAQSTTSDAQSQSASTQPQSAASQSQEQSSASSSADASTDAILEEGFLIPNKETNRINFITQVYKGFLNREPSQNDIIYWNKSNFDTAKFVYTVAYSLEFEVRGIGDDCLEQIYLALLNRTPDSGAITTWQTYIDDGLSRNFIIRKILHSQEFWNYAAPKDLWGSYSAYPYYERRDNAPQLIALMSRAYKVLLGRKATIDELNNASLQSAPDDLFEGWSYPDIVLLFITNTPEYEQKALTDDYIGLLYENFLYRQADAAGLAHWKATLNKGVSLSYVVNGLVNSPEGQVIQKKYPDVKFKVLSLQVRDQQIGLTEFASDLYTNILNRRFDMDGLNLQTQAMLDGTNGKEIAHGFVFSPEMAERNLNNTDFVKVLYKGILGREYDEKGLQTHVTRLNKGVSRETVFQNFVNSPEFKNHCKELGVPNS